MLYLQTNILIMENKPNQSLYKILTAVIILLLIVTFSLQNNTSTEIKFWFWSANAPLIIIIILCFIAGLLFALMAFAPVFKHSKHKSRLIEELKERIDLLEKEKTQ